MDEYARKVILDFWMTLTAMSPYLLFGFLVAGALSVLVSPAMVERHLGGRGIWPVVKASLFGVPLPLCSCGVIPVTVSLYKHGASRAAAISFLLSTPQTGVDSIFVTFSLLGPVFAIFRPVAAFITGIVGGVLVNVFEPVAAGAAEMPARCTDTCCNGGHKRNKITAALRHGFVTLPRDIGASMLVGLVIAAFISAMVPDNFFAEKLGAGLVPMLVMMALGIPIYVCATASVPIAAVLIAKGLSPGAALVFLMTGPATNAASLVIIWRTLGGRTAVVYLISIAACALAGGVLLDLLAAGVDAKTIAHCTWMMPRTVEVVSSVVLFVVLGAAIIKRHKQAEQ